MKNVHTRNGKAYRLPPEFKQKVIATEEKSYVEDRVKFAKDVLKGTPDIRKQIQEGKIEPVSVSTFSFILDFVSIVLESHPNWFKNEESLERVLDRIEELSKYLGAFEKALSGKSREMYQWRWFVTEGLAKPFKDITKKRFTLTSAIVSLIIFLFDEAYPVNTPYHIGLALLTGVLVAMFAVLLLANEGRLLVHVFKEVITELDLNLGAYISVYAYVIVADLDKALQVRFHRERTRKPPSGPHRTVYYEYAFVRKIVKHSQVFMIYDKRKRHIEIL